MSGRGKDNKRPRKLTSELIDSHPLAQRINEWCKNQKGDTVNLPTAISQTALRDKTLGAALRDRVSGLEIDLGEGRLRNIFAGIRKHYAPETLVGRRVVVVANLAPRKMKFGISEGMVLAASDTDSKTAGLYILSPDSGAEPGMRVK